MNKLRIEKNIPIPRRCGNLDSMLLDKTIRALDEGDSFVVKGNKNRAKAINKMRSLKMAYASRCINKPIDYQPSTFEYRIWKINKNS